jgi:hypothetical protein
MLNMRLEDVKENKVLLGAAAVTAAVGGGLLLRRALRCAAMPATALASRSRFRC